MARDTKEMYATMKPWRLFFVVALPGMISMFAMSIYSIIEGIFIGQKLGESAFAAVNIALPIIMINFLLADLVGVGASVPISIALGKKEEHTANNIFSCSVILILGTAVLMGIFMLFAAKPLASFMGAEGYVLEKATKYIQTFALGSPLTTIFFAMDNYLRISGYIKTSMWINVFSNVATIVMLFLFLIVLEMDVVGSALASCIAMCVCAILASIPFLRGNTLLKFVKPVFTVSMLKEIAACGTPIFLSNIAGRITSILMNISLVTLGAKALGEGGGTTAVAAYAVLMYSSEMCTPLLYGISDSLSPALGFNWGAENYDRVKKIAMCNYTGICVISLVSSAIMFLFPGAISSLFINAADTKLIELSAHALKIFSITYLVRWFTIATQHFLSAIEKPLYATIMSISVAFVFPAIMLGLLRPLGLDGIWMNMFGSSILSMLLGVFLIRLVWKKLKAEGLRA